MSICPSKLIEIKHFTFPNKKSKDVLLSISQRKNLFSTLSSNYFAA